MLTDYARACIAEADPGTLRRAAMAPGGIRAWAEREPAREQSPAEQPQPLALSAP